ncbi:SPOR domain-containing protein [Rhodocyclus tenuis]|uniref:Pyruvate/2-oxoglutarate dehydrogenase complex dihydrolipoamide acyltransferase (E2) component n=1 Tax=Rhodocyclus tenuis TaxID=1066 RepID=A0A840G2R3_RHOTE|nr:SPOR domain-containing protein [Rhodocyclus tenuis]MBB4246246.1 pyruvate/2-oxoglutarate dehydrogenase complex dihydrolipoamide acyltransferase (E2) component [Rhodocyclus tenuis]
MRALVFALVFANLLLFAWAQGYFGTTESADAARMQQQLNTDKLFIVKRGETAASDKAPATAESAGPESAPEGEKPAEPTAEKSAEKNAAKAPEKATEKAPEAAPAKAAAKPAEAPAGKPLAKAAETKAAESKTALRCLQWTDLAAADADRLEHLFAERFAAAAHTRSAPPTAASAAGWWVFIPPLTSRADAERKAGELKRLAVPEFFIVQVAGPNRFAISLGIFSSEEAANERLNELREKGVQSARVGERTNVVRGATVEIKVADSDFEALRLAVAQTLPAARATACGGAR